MLSKKNALIIGGGIGGLTLAHAFKRQGVGVRVFERAPRLEPLGAGITLTINAMRALKDIGLCEDVKKEGNSLSSLTLADTNCSPLSTMHFNELCANLHDVPAPVAIHRPRLYQALASHVLSDELALGKEYIDHEEGPDGVNVRFSDGTIENGAFLVGCDGLNSKVRGKVLGEQALRYSGQTCWRGVAQGDAQTLTGATLGEFFELWGNGHRFGMVPVDANNVYWYATAHRLQNERVPKPEIHAELEHMFKGWHPAVRRCIQATGQKDIMQHDLFDRVPMQGWSRGRVVLLGDAVHPTTPSLGQGAGMAIESAAVLARALGQSSDMSLQALSKVFVDYERARYPRTSAITNESWNAGNISTVASTWLQGARNTFMRWVPSSVIEKQSLKLFGYDIYAGLDSVSRSAKSNGHE